MGDILLIFGGGGVDFLGFMASADGGGGRKIKRGASMVGVGWG